MSNSKKLKFKNSDTYIGDINEKNEIEGKGEYYFANGSYYKGNFQNGKFNG